MCCYGKITVVEDLGGCDTVVRLLLLRTWIVVLL
jgi:hypothetical protein